ncbi:hypothetical protein GF361_02505 [Candidatus Woesearchaeota archaeon]|nr:hypothetical protein [Candidatus Woesearchaeota archaeon]
MNEKQSAKNTKNLMEIKDNRDLSKLINEVKRCYENYTASQSEGDRFTYIFEIESLKERLIEEANQEKGYNRQQSMIGVLNLLCNTEYQDYGIEQIIYLDLAVGYLKKPILKQDEMDGVFKAVNCIYDIEES